jgi:hypothetical protein
MFSLDVSIRTAIEARAWTWRPWSLRNLDFPVTKVQVDYGTDSGEELRVELVRPERVMER